MRLQRASETRCVGVHGDKLLYEVSSHRYRVLLQIFRLVFAL